MGDITIIKVENKIQRRRFLTFPWRVYRRDPLWVPPLLPERSKVIDPARNPFFQRGEADFFMALRNGKPVGTIMAAVDPPTNQVRNRKECMFGFFEYIQDYQVFEALLERVVGWAAEHGLNVLLGPFNLDYEDSYGVLLSGRWRPPALLCGHSPVYYQDFMARYGFVPARDVNLAFAIDFKDTPAMRRLSALADKLRQRGRIKIRQVDFDDYPREIDRIHRLLLEALAWAGEGGIPWRRDDLESMVEPFRAFADPELVLFAEVDGEAVGWFPGVPNLNEVFIQVNGLRYPWNYLQLLWYMRQPVKSLTIKSVVVLPEWQKRGAAVLLFDEMARRAKAKGYQWADLSITSADNPDTPQLAARMGAVEYKRWQVYNYFF